VAALQVERELGITITHETHRRRQLFSPWQARDLFALPSLAELKITSDLSHWCVVCEHVFDEGDPRDSTWWPAMLQQLAHRTMLIHARVGFDEAVQVNDWQAPEHSQSLKQFLKWWSTIWAAQAARGDRVTWCEPEFGPAPYVPTLPYTQAPVADIWQLNSNMAKLLRQTFAQVVDKVDEQSVCGTEAELADSAVPTRGGEQTASVVSQRVEHAASELDTDEAMDGHKGWRHPRHWMGRIRSESR